jgi:hypothetical protein
MFADLLKQYKRIAIVGGPKTGKTTHYAAMVTDRPVIHTDDWLSLPYEVVPDVVLAKARMLDSFVVEGAAQMARTLRKGLEVDAVFLTTKPKAPRQPRQVATAKGTLKIFRD